jgi:hypothetical protein
MALAAGIAAHPVLKSVRAKQTAKDISPLIWGSDQFLPSLWRADIYPLAKEPAREEQKAGEFTGTSPRTVRIGRAGCVGRAMRRRERFIGRRARALRAMTNDLTHVVASVLAKRRLSRFLERRARLTGRLDRCWRGCGRLSAARELGRQPGYSRRRRSAVAEANRLRHACFAACALCRGCTFRRDRPRCPLRTPGPLSRGGGRRV